MAGLVIVDAGLAGCIGQNLGLQARGSLQSAPIFDVGSDLRKQVVRQEAEEGVGIPPKAGVRRKARFDRVEAYLWLR